MRVRGNISPNTLDIENYHSKPGYVEVRLRENINVVSVIDEMTEQEVKMFEYDEYTIIIRDRDGLREDIESNMTDWLATGRSLEINEKSSILVSTRRENEELLSDLAAMVDAVYESDLERIEA